LTQSWGGTTYFIYLPWSVRYRSSLSVAPAVRSHANVRGIVEQLGIPIIDVDSVFRSRGNPRSMYWYIGSHPNPAGNQVIADAVLERIVAHIVTPTTAARRQETLPQHKSARRK
jgi:hypothetical protein